MYLVYLTEGALTLDTSSSQLSMRDRSPSCPPTPGPAEGVGNEEEAPRSCSSVPGRTSRSTGSLWTSSSSVSWSCSEAVTPTTAPGCHSPGVAPLHRVFISRISSCLRTAWSRACRAAKLTAPFWGVPMDKFTKSYKLMFCSDILFLNDNTAVT